MRLGCLELNPTYDCDDRLHALYVCWHVQPIGTAYTASGTRMLSLQFELPYSQISFYIHGGFQEGMRWYQLINQWVVLLLLLLLILTLLLLL